MPTKDTGDVLHRSHYDQVGFTQVHNLVLYDPKISFGAKTLYTVLKSYADRAGMSWPGQGRLSKILCVSDRQIRRYMDELSERHLVTVEQRGQNKTNRYWLEPLDHVYGSGDLNTYWERRANSTQVQSLLDRTPVSTPGSDRTPVSTPDRTHTSSPDRTPVSYEVHPDESTSRESTSSSCAEADASSASEEDASKTKDSAPARSKESFAQNDAPSQGPRNRLQQAMATQGTAPVKKGGLRGPTIRGRKTKRADQGAKAQDEIEADADRRANSPRRKARTSRQATRNWKPEQGAKYAEWCRWAEEQRLLSPQERRQRKSGALVKPPEEWTPKDLLKYFCDVSENHLKIARPGETPKVLGQAGHLVRGIGSTDAKTTVDYLVEHWHVVRAQLKVDRAAVPTLGIMLGYLDQIRAMRDGHHVKTTGTHRTHDAQEYPEGDKAILEWSD